MTNTITPEVGKTYLTRDGRKARCICTNRQEDGFSVVCLVEDDGTEAVETYTTSGKLFNAGDTELDLVSEAPRVVTLDVWVELTQYGAVVDASPWDFETNKTGNSVVKITQDVELSNV